MTNAAFAGLLWMALGAYACIKYYSSEPYIILAVAVAASQAAMAIADVINAFGLTPSELIALAAVVAFIYDIRAIIQTSIWQKTKLN